MNDRHDGFTDFYRNHCLRLVRFLMHSGATFEEAQDAAQDTMVAAFERWSTIRDPAAYVRTTALRTSLRSAVR